VAAALVYGLPALAWVLEPLLPRPRARARTAAVVRTASEL
jgi:hypothetical protein